MKTIILLSLILTSCATMMHGVNQKIPITSDPPAQIEINSQPMGVTPMIYKTARNKDFEVLLTADGYQVYRESFNKEVDPLVIGNLLIGGIPGLLIDFVSGGAFKFPEEINIKLQK